MRTGKRIRVALTVATLVSFLGITTACYGPFNLTRSLYKWNGEISGSGQVESKWMREGVFLALVIIPVYEFSLLIDALLLNSIEFWGGENPVKLSDTHEDGRTRVVRLGETIATMTAENDGNSVHVTYAKAGRVFKRGEIVKAGDSYRFVDGTGHHLYSAEMRQTGELTILDENNRLVGEISPELLLSAKRLASAQASLQFAANE